MPVFIIYIVLSILTEEFTGETERPLTIVWSNYMILTDLYDLIASFSSIGMN